MLFSAMVVSSLPIALAFPSIDDGSLLTPPISEEEMVKILSEYNTKSAVVSNRVGLAEWAVATDVGNKEKQEKYVRSVQSFKSQIYWYCKSKNVTDSIQTQIIQSKLYFANNFL